MERYYRTNLQLVMANQLTLLALNSADDDWGLYVDGDYGILGTPLMLRGTKQEIVDFLVDRNLTGKVENF
jgi:hypothetical protein